MFEITIKEKISGRKIVRGEHAVIDRRPYTDAELSESSRWMESELGKKGELKPIYGYAPDREEDVENEREILKQTVETLDLPAVIKAINNLT